MNRILVLMTVLLARNIQTAHADLASNVTSGSNSVIDVATIDRFQAFGEVGLRLINGEINRQAAMIAYIDDFWLMMWMTLAAVPLAFLMRRDKRPVAPPAPAADH